MEVVENVRYLLGAPDSWSTWLRTGDVVTISLEEADRATVPEDSVNSLHLANDLVVRSAVGHGRVPLNHIVDVDTGNSDPLEAELAQSDPGTRPSSISSGLMRLAALTALPRRPVRWLRVGLKDHSMVFDVTDRRWASEALVTPEAENSLERMGQAMVFVRDRSYRWISVKRFRAPEFRPGTPSDLLARLIGHPAYWDTYTGGDDIVPNVHGPYRLDAITTGSFQSVDASTASSMLDEWLGQYGPVSEDQIEGDLAAIHGMFQEADACFNLPDLGHEAHHETGWILHSGFLEFVLIGPDEALVLVVASGD